MAALEEHGGICDSMGSRCGLVDVLTLLERLVSYSVSIQRHVDLRDVSDRERPGNVRRHSLRNCVASENLGSRGFSFYHKIIHCIY